MTKTIPYGSKFKFGTGVIKTYIISNIYLYYAEVDVDMAIEALLGSEYSGINSENGGDFEDDETTSDQPNKHSSDIAYIDTPPLNFNNYE